MAEQKWEKIAPSFSLEDDRLADLKNVVPEAFTDGNIDFDVLRELLGDTVEDESAEHFGLNWTGKREARRLAGMPSKGTLVPVPEKGLHEDTTENIFIEGDNLEVLKLLHKSYRGKIKMIYIDPPYNTGNDFIYKDDYRMPLDSYLERSRQKSDAGELLTSNPKSSGRFHSDWLNMMYPRLRVAKDLLREDGVIFVSIDDNEVHNLREIMSEIFGEENLVSTIIWEKKYAKQNDATWFSTSHDYILLFARNKDLWRPNRFERSAEQLKGYSNPDNDARGDWQSVVYTCNKTRQERPNLYYSIKHPKTGEEIYPDETRVWGCDHAKHLEHVKENRLWWGKDQEKSKPRMKVFLSEVGSGVVPDTLWLRGDSGDNQDAKKAILKLFKFAVFDTPKPTKLIKKMLKLATSSTQPELVLDFFAGSGTFAEAVMEANEDGGRLAFICVQIDEEIKKDSDAYKAGFRTISDITAERIRRASQGIESTAKHKLNLGPRSNSGFVYFRLNPSNFLAWSDYQGNDLDELRGLLQAQLDSTFVEGATENSILTEILLLEGFPLTSKIEIDATFQKNTVRLISHEWSEHRLFVTLDKEIQEETVRTVDDLIDSETMSRLDNFICLDNALTDQDKLRLADVCRLKTL